MGMGGRTRNFLAAAAATLAGAAFAAPVAQADVVSNAQAGTLGATISSLTLTLGSVPYTLTSGTFASGGSVDPSGNLSFPSLTVPFSVPAPSVLGIPGLSTGAGTLTLSSIAPLAGTIDPSTGEAALSGTLKLVEQIPLVLGPASGTLDCMLASVPINASTGATGGSAYNQATGALTLADHALTLAPSCTPSNPLLAAAVAPVETALGLAAGTGKLDLGLLLNPILKAGPVAVLLATPPLGTVPFSSVLDASGSIVPAGVKRYDWDTNGDGVTDVTTAAGTPMLPLSVPIPGILTAGVTVVDLNDDTSRATTLVTGLLGIVTGGGGGGGGSTGGTGGGTTGAGTTGTSGGAGGRGAAAAGLDASKIVSLPSMKRCISRRVLHLALRAPAGTTIKSATVRIGKGRARRLTGGALRGVAVNLRGLPKGTYAVIVNVTFADGRNVTLRRTYHTCVSKQRHS